MSFELIRADCAEAMRAMPRNSIDAIVTDPPYLIGFMNKEFDRQGGAHKNSDKMEVWHRHWAAEALPILKPGGHIVAFGGARTYHRLTCALEDAGFEMRDCLMWLYGSGFPKSEDISKALDLAAGIERPVLGSYQGATNIGRIKDGKLGYAPGVEYPDAVDRTVVITKPQTENAKRWSGWGTALKPAWEPIILARKPISESNIAANVLRWGTGAINVGACRIGGAPGRWPANLVLDDVAAAMLDHQNGPCGDRGGGPTIQPHPTTDAGSSAWQKGEHTVFHIGDSGGTSRFFYTAKTNSAERNAGLYDLQPEIINKSSPGSPGSLSPRAGAARSGATYNFHPTVKPLSLMVWLCRLISPPGGLVLDPFVGSGSTGIAALRLGLSFIGIDTDADYLAIARRRIEEDAPLFNCEIG